MIPLTAVSVVVLAAGLSKRHPGENKLARPLRGKPLAAHVADTLATLPFLQRIAVVAELDAKIAEIFARRNFTVIANAEPARGQGHSLALGVARALQDNRSQAIMVCLADMPFVSARLIEKLAAALSTDSDAAICVVGDHITPPAIFRRRHAEPLLTLDGDVGARKIVAALTHVAKVEASPDLLADFDTDEDFKGQN
ncbi:MAG: nucleotidyltransferase family protein [Proteobacteria bacterium]|nr:MAG: nucleotidyltransferase family protein [Pseudomonadota bacterium]